jgi:hypothetical protein
MDAKFDVAVVKMATAIANEWQAFSLQELAVYCQQAVLSGYNPVARPWECIPVRSDDGERVSLWPTYSAVIADGAEWLAMQGVNWKYRDEGSAVRSPTPSQKEDNEMLEGDVLYQCVIEHGKARRSWQKEIGRLVKDGWPYEAAAAHVGACPPWDVVTGHGVVGAAEGEPARMRAVGAMRARRNAWLMIVTPSEMHVARKQRSRTLMQDVGADMTTYEGESSHDRLNKGVSDLNSETPWG